MTLTIVRRLMPEWGTTYGPPGDGPFPAIMVLHGSEGGPVGLEPPQRRHPGRAPRLPFTGKRVGLYGISRGAEHALLLASLMARDGAGPVPDAIAAHSPADVVCGAFDSRNRRDKDEEGWEAWDPAKRAWSWRGSSDGLLPSTPIAVEAIVAPLFLSHGTEDSVWSAAMTRRLAERLRAHGIEPEVHLYDGQEHLPGSAAENEHHGHLIAFFERHLIA